MAIAAWKKAKTIPDGFTVTREDGAIKSVEFELNGQKVRIVTDGYYSLSVMTPEPPTKAKKYRVSGDMLGVPVQEDFDEKYEADARAQELASAVREDVTISVSDVDVEIPF